MKTAADNYMFYRGGFPHHPSHFGIHTMGICLAVLLAIVCFASPVTANGASPQEDFLKTFQEKRKTVQTYQADFSQKKILALFDEVKVSTGQVFFKAPHRMIWKYQTPDKTEMLVTREAVSFYFPALEQIEVYQMNQGKGAAPFFFAFEATADEITETFSLAGPATEDGLERIELTPKNDPLASEVKTIVLWLSAKDYLPRKILINEITGDTTEIIFTSAKINQPITDEDLKLSAPEGTEIIEGNSGI